MSSWFMVYPTQPPMLLTGDGCLTHVIQFLAAKYGSDRKLKVINLTSSKAQHEAYWPIVVFESNSRGWSLKSGDPVGGVGTDFYEVWPSDLRKLSHLQQLRNAQRGKPHKTPVLSEATSFDTPRRCPSLLAKIAKLVYNSNKHCI